MSPEHATSVIGVAQKGSGGRKPKPAWMTQITSVAPRLVLVLSNQIVRSSTIFYNLYLNWLVLYSSETLRPFIRRVSDKMRRLHKTHTAGIKWHHSLAKAFLIITSNNQRLGSAGDNDRRSKRFCSNAVLCVSFTWQMVKTRVIRLRGVEGRDAHDQLRFVHSIHS